MDEIREEFIAAEECLMDVLSSYMELCDRILEHPEHAKIEAKYAKSYWMQLLWELREKHAQHTATVKDGE